MTVSSGSGNGKNSVFSPQNGETPKLQVLIVDDDFFARQMTRCDLEQAGYEVVGEAGDGLEAIGLIRALQPDFILMDMDMPRMDGLQATRFIHQYDDRTPIFILSGYSSPDRVEEATLAGARAYLIKPLLLHELEKTLSQVM